MPRIKSQQIVFESERFKILRQRIEVADILFEQDLIAMGDGIVLLVLDRDQNILMVKEWRSSINDYLFQLPGGYVGNNEERILLKRAKEEVLQELGVSDFGSIQKIKTFMPIGGIKCQLHLYLIEEPFKTQLPEPETGECIEVVKFPVREAYERFVKGEELTTAATIIGLSWLVEKLNLK